MIRDLDLYELGVSDLKDGLQQRGRMEMESELGKGSVFRIVLPSA